MQIERADGTAIEEEFAAVHSALFERGAIEIGYFVRPGSGATAEELMQEAIGFQRAVDAGRVRQVQSVD